MDRINNLWTSPTYQQLYQRLSQLEENRIFCGHSLEHLLSVARLAYIYSLEDESHISKELIYATALLHDIGRVAEYEQGISHHLASMQIAEELLPSCGFTSEEILEITQAIGSHRSAHCTSDKKSTLLASYLKKADKKSRNCMICPAESQCNWAKEKKNFLIEN